MEKVREKNNSDDQLETDESMAKIYAGYGPSRRTGSLFIALCLLFIGIGIGLNL